MKQILSVICLIIVYSSEVFGQGFAWAQGYTSTASGSNNVGISAIASYPPHQPHVAVDR